LVVGLKRVEEAFQLLGQRGSMGCERKARVLGFGDSNPRTKQQMGNKRNNEGVGWSKPKKKIFRSIKTQPGLLGPKPSKESGQLSQGPGPKSSFSYRVLSRIPSQELRQVGESSAMGAARATGGNGTTIAGDFSGEHSSGVGVTIPATVTMTREAENDGEHNGGDGIGEESSTQRLVSCTEDAEGLGIALSTPEKSYKLSDSSSSLLSTIPESDVALGHAMLSPVKRSKRLSVPSEQARDEGIDSFTPDKQPKQMLVYQRRESPSSKTTKSWVAERVSWNGDRGCNVPTEVLLEKKHKSCLASEESPANVCSMLGEHEELGMLGVWGIRRMSLQVLRALYLSMKWKFPLKSSLSRGWSWLLLLPRSSNWLGR
jgi:hypothetical protein